MPMNKSPLSTLGICAAIATIWMPSVAVAEANPTQLAGDRQSIASLDTAIQQNPRDLDAYLQRGRLNAKLDRSLLAIADYTEIIRLDPNHAVAYNDRAMVKLNLKDYWGAYLDYSQVVRLLPDKAIVYNNRAAARHQLGDCKGAIADLRIAAELFRQQGDRSNYQLTMDNLKYFQRSLKR
jgi:tetratricopeptide (TPR) repeat protein